MVEIMTGLRGGLGVIGLLIGVLLVLAPLFIWHHVVMMRTEARKRMAELLENLAAQTRELKKATTLSVEMQKRYVKTMQYVCDRLADICDKMDAESKAHQA